VTLPRALTKELHVRSKLEVDEEELKKRQHLVGAKSPAELSQISSFSEIPIPSRIETWLRSNESEKGSVKCIWKA
jgi:hypothetical protein